MRIKTITCHNVNNFGASLQAHALLTYLTDIGNDVEVIDYMPSYIRKNLSIFAIGTKYKKNIFLALAFFCYVVPVRLLQWRMRKKFCSFTKNNLKLTQRYNSYEELKNNPPQADVIFCGSDQIWNTNIQNGLDPAFYADFAPQGTIRASYAASFSVSEIPAEHQIFVKSMLAKMDFISVRESTGLKILYGFGITKGTLVCDPVFLLSRNHWLGMTEMPKYSNYILVYDQENSKPIRSIAIALAKKEGKQIVAISGLYPMSYADHQVRNTGPQDFLSLIAYADIVITNSFHCSAFSLIMGKQFFVVNRTHQKVNSRMKDLLSYLDIASHVVGDFDDVKKAETIDYTKLTPLLEKIKIRSKSYISEVLNKAKESRSLS